MKARFIVIPALALSFQGAVAAQQTGTPEDMADQEGIPTTPHQEEATRDVTGEGFSMLDQNGDGMISSKEAQAKSALADNWSQYDQNGDGMLDQDEFGRFEQSSAAEEQAADVGPQGEVEEGIPTTPHQEQALDEELVGHLDRDGDGAISQQEAESDAQLADNWDHLDENRDGMLDSQELDQLEEKLADIEEAE